MFEAMTDEFVHGRYNVGFDKMYGLIVRDDNNWRMGGSTAQKKIFPLTMIEMGFRAGRYTQLKGLLKEELQCRPIWSCTALNLCSRMYRDFERDHKTAGVYQKMKQRMI